MTTELIINPKDFGLEPEKVTSIEAAFAPKVIEREGLHEVYKQLLTKEITIPVCAEAATLRKKLVKVRTGIADIHRTQKAFFLASGKFVDAWKNKETLPVVQMENELSKIEKFHELQILKRLEKLQSERVELLSQYVEDAADRDLKHMEADVWNAYFAAKKKEYEDRIAAEKKAEADRIEAAKVEAERVRLMEVENDKLKEAADKAAKQAQAEKLERERLELIETDRRARVEDERQAKAKAEREAYETELKAEREKAAKIEAEATKKRQALEVEIQTKKDNEAKIEVERLANIQADLNKGDAAKVTDLIEDLNELKSKYQFRSKKNQQMYIDTCTLIDKVVNHIQTK